MKATCTCRNRRLSKIHLEFLNSQVIAWAGLADRLLAQCWPCRAGPCEVTCMPSCPKSLSFRPCMAITLHQCLKQGMTLPGQRRTDLLQQHFTYIVCAFWLRREKGCRNCHQTFKFTSFFHIFRQLSPSPSTAYSPSPVFF